MPLPVRAARKTRRTIENSSVRDQNVRRVVRLLAFVGYSIVNWFLNVFSKGENNTVGKHMCRNYICTRAHALLTKTIRHVARTQWNRFRFPAGDFL